MFHDSASAVVLEEELGWDPASVGVLLSLAYFAALFEVQAAFDALGRRLTELGLMRAFTLLAVAGSALFFPAACGLLRPLAPAPCTATYLLGSTLYFSSFLFVNGIVSAWLLNSAREEGWFTLDNYT